MKTRPKPERRTKPDRRVVPRAGRRATDLTAEEREFRIRQQLEFLRRQKKGPSKS